MTGNFRAYVRDLVVTRVVLVAIRVTGITDYLTSGPLSEFVSKSHCCALERENH